MSEKEKPADARAALEGRIAAVVGPMGYQVVDLEIHRQRQGVIRLFIDRLEVGSRGIGIDDCVAVTKALGEPLDTWPEAGALFPGSYELEVSSPGLDRPLRRPEDFEKYKGRLARVRTFAPVVVEIGAKPVKQKNFLGILEGFRNGSEVLLKLKDGGASVAIPLSAVCKANLEPVFEGGKSMDRRKEP